MDAIVTAGGIPQPYDLLYPYTQGNPKALLDIAGKPMVQWVLDAISTSETGQVVVVGLEADDGIHCSKRLTFIPNQGEMLKNIPRRERGDPGQSGSRIRSDLPLNRDRNGCR